MIEIDYTFYVETDPEAAFLWWASCHVGGGLAMGYGHSPWEAIAGAIADVPKAIERCRLIKEVLASAEAGTYHCPGCGVLRPPLAGAFWAFYCDACRGE